MKGIYKYLRTHLKEDFSLSTYLLVAAFLAVAIYSNYHFNIKKGFIYAQPNLLRVLYLVIFYGLAFYVPILIFRLFGKNKNLLKSGKMWLLSFVGITLIATDVGSPFLYDAIRQLPFELRLFTFKVSKNLLSIFTIFLPLLMLYKAQPHKDSFYGLTLKEFNYKPYVAILLVMLPIVAFASFTDNLGSYYPMYKTTPAHVYLNIPEWVTVLTYEVAYGWDFLTVEMIFRGFFVVVLGHYLGRPAVLAMASFYCFLHFGKPELEAISSIFGGYILGVIAYESRSVFGGVIIHIGIAWMMEVFGYLQKIF